MISLIYIIGCVISFFLITYIFHEYEGKLDKDMVVMSMIASGLSWLSLALCILVLIYIKYIAKFNIPDKIVNCMNKLYSKKNNHKEK